MLDNATMKQAGGHISDRTGKIDKYDHKHAIYLENQQV